MGNTEYFELCETSSKHTISWLRLKLGSGHYKLHMQPTERNRQLNKARCDVLSIPGHVIKKESNPRCQTWTICAAVHVLHSTWYAEESPQAQKWWLQNHSGKMARWWQIPQVFVRSWVDWGTDHSIWRSRIGRSFLRGNVARKKSER